MSSKGNWLNAGITLFNGKISLTFLFLLLSLPAFGAGGTCPSGANYTNPANPTGSLVTLASLGITSCYYVSAAGSDSSYDGTQETVSGSHGPFLHAPGMGNCSNNCAAVHLAAGMGIIFRGGDTWHFGNSSASPYAGTVSGCSSNNNNPAGWCLAYSYNSSALGTSSHQVYFGFDPAWYAGGSWARAVFSADNSLCNASTVGTLPDGATCTATTDTFGQPSYYVSSCPYQVTSSNNLVDLSNAAYYILDNFEMTGLCQNQANNQAYVHYPGADGPVTFMNNYIHGASHIRYAGPVASAACNVGGAVCLNLGAFSGSVPYQNSGTVGETVVLNVVDYSDSDAMGAYGSGMYNFAYNVTRYFVGTLVNPLHVVHDNLFEYMREDGHSNLIESVDPYTTNAIYNNVFRHIENLLTSGGGVGLWFGPQSGDTDYIFNNVMYDVGPMEYINVGGTGVTSDTGNYVFFNNTFQSDAVQPILRCNGQTAGTTTDINNHYIDDQNYILGPCSALTTTTALAQTNAQADANVSTHFDHYTASETHGYSPVASTNSTVGAGTNKYSGYCSALSTAGLSAAATACQSDITYACSYAGNGAPPVCPARTVTARPTSAAWDIGAYEYGASAPPNPPAGLTAVVH